MKDVGIVITTFERDQFLFNCVQSIRKFYENVSIYVIDQGKTNDDKERFLSNCGCDLIQLPWDSGLSLARNIGLKRMTEKYVVICDDDFVFTKDTKLEIWRDLLNKFPNVGIAAGLLVQRGHEWHYEHKLELRDDRYIIKDFKADWKRFNNIRYFYTDLCLNFFMMKKRMWHEVKWDNDYKIVQEHLQFFLDVKYRSKWRVIYTPSVSAEHNKVPTKDEYEELRASKQRKMRSWNLFYRKTGIKFAVHRLNREGGLKVIDLSTGESISPHSLFLDKVYKTHKVKDVDHVLKETEISTQIVEDTAVLVTTFLRDELLYRCISSIRKYYPEITIYIGDNGRTSDEKKSFCKQNNCNYLEFPFDLGVAGVRNESMKRISKRFKYIMVVEDDIIFTDQTRLEKLRIILDAEPKLGIMGVLLKINDSREQHYEADIWLEDKTFNIVKNKSPDWLFLNGIKYYFCDIILNVFMMRREVWDLNKWDIKFKTALEHSDFFLSIKYKIQDEQPVFQNGNPVRRRRPWKRAYTPSISMYHKKGTELTEYNKYRARRIGWSIFGEKWRAIHVRSSFDTEDIFSIESLENKAKIKEEVKKPEIVPKQIEMNKRELTEEEKILKERKAQFWRDRLQA